MPTNMQFFAPSAQVVTGVSQQYGTPYVQVKAYSGEPNPLDLGGLVQELLDFQIGFLHQQGFEASRSRKKENGIAVYQNGEYQGGIQGRESHYDRKQYPRRGSDYWERKHGGSVFLNYYMKDPQTNLYLPQFFAPQLEAEFIRLSR